MAENKHHIFTRFAKWTAHVSGKPKTFILAVFIIILWALTGPIFDYSDTWQLVINTGTTIITFLMVFLIQNTQNRDTESIQVKLDELIRVNQEARNQLLDLEEVDDEELDLIHNQYLKLAERAHEELKAREKEKN